MPRPDSDVVVTRAEREQLESIVRSRSLSHGLVRRARTCWMLLMTTVPANCPPSWRQSADRQPVAQALACSRDCTPSITTSAPNHLCGPLPLIPSSVSVRLPQRRPLVAVRSLQVADPRRITGRVGQRPDQVPIQDSTRLLDMQFKRAERRLQAAANADTWRSHIDMEYQQLLNSMPEWNACAGNGMSISTSCWWKKPRAAAEVKPDRAAHPHPGCWNTPSKCSASDCGS